MDGSLADRVSALEKELAEVKDVISQQSAGKPAKNDWRAWIGVSKDDPGFREMIRLGREYREGPHFEQAREDGQQP